MKNKIGRPLKEFKKPTTICVVHLSVDANERLMDLVDRSYMSKTGIVRMAIDYLYYSMDGNIPNELGELLNDLKNNIKIDERDSS